MILFLAYFLKQQKKRYLKYLLWSYGPMLYSLHEHKNNGYDFNFLGNGKWLDDLLCQLKPYWKQEGRFCFTGPIMYLVWHILWSGAFPLFAKKIIYIVAEVDIIFVQKCLYDKVTYTVGSRKDWTMCFIEIFKVSILKLFKWVRD